MPAPQPANSIDNTRNTMPVVQPTDMYIQPYLKELVPELSGLSRLQEAERRIDVYLNRKKIDMHQNITQWTHSRFVKPENSQILRIFVSNISENQPWQMEDGVVDLAQGSWTLRVEGRLLNNQKADDPERIKFSSFLDSIAVDFVTEKEGQESGGANELSNGNASDDTKEPASKKQKCKSDIFEWHADPSNAIEFDGLDVTRRGTENVKCNITIQPKGYTGEYLQYSPDLTKIIGLSKGSLHEAIYSLYKYILSNDLLLDNEEVTSQENSNGDKVLVKLDTALTSLFTDKSLSPPKSLKLIDLPGLIKDHIKPIPPIRFEYVVRVDKSSTYGDLVFDVEVPKASSDKKDLTLSSDVLALLNEYNALSTRIEPQLQALNKKVQLLQVQLNSTAKKYQFFHNLATDPVNMLSNYMDSSSRALKVLSGDAGFNEDTVRRAEFYKENESVLFENIGVLLSSGRMKH